MVVDLPTMLNYPIVAIGDLHGQFEELKRLIDRVDALTVWPDPALMFLDDFVDRNARVRETIDLVLELLRRPASGSAVLGNHDLALVRAARLDSGPPLPYWVDRYQTHYDHGQTFESYLGRAAMSRDDAWRKDLDTLRGAIPEGQRAFHASLPWLVEAPGHLFLHSGLSNELKASPEEQVASLRS